MQKTCTNQLIVRSVFGKLHRHRKGMCNIGLTVLACLPSVNLQGEQKGFFYHVRHAMQPSFPTKHNSQHIFPIRVFVVNARCHLLHHEDTEATDIAFLC